MSQTPLADELGRISRDEFNRYLQDFRPVEQDVIESLNNSTVGKSMDAAQGDAIRARESLARMRERYGTTVTDAQAVGESRQNSLSGALGMLSAGNNAYLADRDNREQTLAGLMNTGQIIRQQALGNWTSAAGTETQRANTNAANASAYKQQKTAAHNSNIQAGAATAATIAAAMI